MKVWLQEVRKALEDHKTYLQSASYKNGPGAKEGEDRTTRKIKCADEAIKIIDNKLLPAFKNGNLTTVENLIAIALMNIQIVESGYYSR